MSDDAQRPTSDAETEAEAGAESEIKPETDAESESETETESETEPKSDSKSASKKSRPKLWPLLKRDARRVAALTLVGCAVFAFVEYWLTVDDFRQPIRFVTWLRFAMLTVTLTTVLWILVTPLAIGLAWLARFGKVLDEPGAAGEWRGLFAPREKPLTGFDRRVPWLWAVFLVTIVFMLMSGLTTYGVLKKHKDPELISIALSIRQIVLLAVLAMAAWVAALATRWVGEKLQPHLRAFNPLGRLLPALVLIGAVSFTTLKVLLRKVPQLDKVVPYRLLIATAAFCIGFVACRWLLGRRGRLLPAHGRRRTMALVALGLIPAVIAPVTLLKVGGDPEAKYLAFTSSPPLRKLMTAVRKANDFDGDGYGSLLGENDCAPFNKHINPSAFDKPDNGIDEDCDGKDASIEHLRKLHKGERPLVPDKFVRDWNFLFITIDTVRYDHTHFGGYHRDTTPNLDKLVKRSTSFTFTNAPSAGTMASIPAILTSKFFHSGVAMNEKVSPPRLLPSNVMMSEVLKSAGYTTGAILTHYYFRKWGMRQGFDYYNNDLGAKRNPRSITSDKVTDRALQWISRNYRKKWFLWLHYLDPHGYYVPHEEKSYGSKEKDLYDAEIWYTDKHIGRLLDQLRQIPGHEKTIVIITADHGDGFNEHGFTSHAVALYQELVHVPMIFYIPGLPARRVGGAVSNLDILPTMADLAGIQYNPEEFEGESLAGQLFYNHVDHKRVVYSETDLPQPQRAAITERYKLIYRMRSNIYELYDLRKDPGEKHNIASRDHKAFKLMKAKLKEYLDRVFYSRNTVNNLSARKLFKLNDIVLKKPPKPQYRVAGVSFDNGNLKLIGYDLDKKKYKPGSVMRVAVYFEVTKRPTKDYKLQVDAWGADDKGMRTGRATHTRIRFTGGQAPFPTSEWHKGDFIRDRFLLRIPRLWKYGEHLGLGLRMTQNRGQKTRPTGKTLPTDRFVSVFGIVPYEGKPRPANSALPKPGAPGIKHGANTPNSRGLRPNIRGRRVTPRRRRTPVRKPVVKHP